MPNAQLRTVETNVNHQEKQTIFYCTYYTKAASIIVQEHHCNSLQDYKEDECRCQNKQKIIKHLRGPPNSDIQGKIGQQLLSFKALSYHAQETNNSNTS